MITVTVRKKTPIETVECLLKTIKIPRSRRAAVSDESVQTVTMGQINQPFHKFKGHSKFTEKHPELWTALQKMADFINPSHRWTSVTINHNVICKPHKDKRNDGITMIIGLGNYTGGELSVDGIPIDINHKPHYFNGYLHEHFNLPFEGDRYSLMFYSLKKSWDIEHRPQDIPIIREVYHGNQYHCRDIGFGIEPGELWIDIGAHIGCWSRKCHYYGASAISYEPDIENFNLLRHNNNGPCYNVAISVNGGASYINRGGPSYFKHLCDDSTGQHVECIPFESVIVPGCCVKMDIEGSEIPILDHCDFSGIKKLVLAYHIKSDPSRTNFLRRMDRLRKWFGCVHHQTIKDEHMNFFPNEIIVYAMA